MPFRPDVPSFTEFRRSPKRPRTFAVECGRCFFLFFSYFGVCLLPTSDSISLEKTRLVVLSFPIPMIIWKYLFFVVVVEIEKKL